MRDELHSEKELRRQLKALRRRVAELEAAQDVQVQLKEELEDRVRELQFMNEAFVTASRIGDVDKMCTFVAETVREVNPGVYVVVSLHDRGRGVIRIRAVAGFGDRAQRILELLGSDPREMTFHPSQMGDEIELYKTGKLERVPGGIHQLLTGRLPRAACRAVERLLNIGAVYTAGFALEGEPYGGLILLIPPGEPVRYRSAIETLVSHASVIMHRRQAEEALRQRVDQLSLLNDIGSKITAALDLEVVLDRTTYLVQESFGYHHVAIFLLDRQRNQLAMRAVSGEFIDVFPPDHQLELGQGMVGWTGLWGHQLLANDVRDEPRYINLYADRTSTRSELTVPIKMGDEVLGVLDVQSPELNAFDQDDVMVLETVAGQVAAAIDLSRLFRVEREQREVSEALEEAAAVVGGTLDLDRVLDRILEQIARVIPGDAFNVMLVQDEVAHAARWRGYQPGTENGEDAGFSLPISSYPYLARVIDTGEPALIPDTRVEPACVREGWSERWRSCVTAPIQVTDLTVGLLNVIGRRLGQFGPDDARRLKAFSRHAAIAIENAELYQELRRYADRLEERVQERTAQIQAHYARFEAILSSTADGIIVTDGGGHILQVNPVANSWMSQTLDPEEAERLRVTLRALAPRAEEEPEALLELKEIDLQLSAAPITGATGDERVVIAAHDVSYLKELDRLKSRFVSNVSHELRTPITSIQLYASLMRKHPERWEEFLEPLVEEAAQQARLVETILQISRADAGRLELDTRPQRLNSLVERVVESHQVLAREQGVALIGHLAKPSPVVEVDSERMTQVLNNLVQNAINYTPAGGEVTVTTGEEMLEDRPWTTVDVTDTGIGIPSEELPHIFDRFFRGEEPRRERMPGTGLGLAIVEEIVALHGGRVTVESDVGAGSTFTVWLPREEEL
jgi:signal transduction histidine kinase/putative methionine-R-sulfoxide reductase with GAF domain